MSATLQLRAAEECRYDLVALGEVMLRFDPGEGRIRDATSFRVWEGGGEYNVARSASQCFGLRTAVVTALADNEIGRLLDALIARGGVSTEWVRWLPYDGVGRTVRNGLNFTERGYGARGTVGVPDRGNTAISQVQPGDIDWSDLFGRAGVRWFHTGGIFAGLSPSTAMVAVEAVEAARSYGTIVSYDPNYRPSLWQDVGGWEAAVEVDRLLAARADVLIGLDVAGGASPLTPGGGSPGRGALVVAGGDDELGATLADLAARFPGVTVVAATHRRSQSATRNDWAAGAWSAVDGLVRSTARPGFRILDRIGGGDGFAAGLIYGLLRGLGLAAAVEYGAAHAALTMTTPGDTSMTTLAEVEAMVHGADEA